MESRDIIDEIVKNGIAIAEPKGKKRKAAQLTPAEVPPEKIQKNAKATEPPTEAVTKRKISKIKPTRSKAVSVTNNSTSSVIQPTANFESPGADWNFKITSWNVAGLRALVKKDGKNFFLQEDADIICLQETKCTEEEVPTEMKMTGYHRYWHGMKGGQAGVALYSKAMPYEVTYGINDAEMDQDARVITAEYIKFFVVCVYVPNAGRKLVNLNRRLQWDVKFRKYLSDLDERKAVILCGDLNVAHLEIDLANPKTNRKNAGFTQEERDGMSQLLSEGFVDSFRALHPDERNAYTFWTYIGNARSKNVGWRLDYFVVSERLMTHVVDNLIRSQVTGSDHCPVTLFLKV